MKQERAGASRERLRKPMHPRGRRCAAGATDTDRPITPSLSTHFIYRPGPLSLGPFLSFFHFDRILLCRPTPCLLLSNLALSICVLFLLFYLFCCTHRSWCNPRSHSAATFNNTCTTLPRLPTTPIAASKLYITPFSAAFLFMPGRL
jgi:hypothetical protein